MKRFTTLASLVIGCVLCSQSSKAFADPVAECNAYSTNTYENNWVSSAAYRDSKCNGFLTEMNTYTDASRQYWLDPVVSYFNEGTDSANYGLDKSDFSMVCTHGGIWTNPDRFSFAMKADHIRALSNNMRLGDDANGLSVLLAAACDTMAVHGTNSTQWQNRWWPVFNGGLRFAAGFWNKTFSNQPAAATEGSNFAECIHAAGSTLFECWSSVMLSSHSLNTPILMSSGTDNNNARYRVNEMTMQNYYQLGRLRDSCANNLFVAFRPNTNVSFDDVPTAGPLNVSSTRTNNYDIVVTNRRNEVLEQLEMDFLGTKSVSPIIAETTRDRHITAIGNNMMQIMVYDDGSHASFLNKKLRDKIKTDLPEYVAASNAENDGLNRKLVEISRQYLDKVVSKYLNLKSFDSIYLYNVTPIVAMEGNKDSVELDQKVLGYEVTFKRLINDMPVIGSGSTIRISLNTDMDVYGFSFDWPELVPATNSFDSISMDEYESRKDELFGNKAVEMENCGFYDFGSTLHSDYNVKTLQLACENIVELSDVESEVFVIPMAHESDIIPEIMWRESYIFSGNEVPEIELPEKDN